MGSSRRGGHPRVTSIRYKSEILAKGNVMKTPHVLVLIAVFVASSGRSPMSARHRRCRERCDARVTASGGVDRLSISGSSPIIIERIKCSDAAIMTKPKELGAIVKPMVAATRISGISTWRFRPLPSWMVDLCISMSSPRAPRPRGSTSS